MKTYCFKHWYNNNTMTEGIYHTMTENINTAYQSVNELNSTEQKYPIGDRYTYIVIECEDHNK